MIDLQAPVIGGPTLAASNNYNVPPLTETNTLTVTYSCNDQAGSGVASCSGQVTPALSTSTSCTQVTTELWKCTSLMTVTPTTSTGTYTFNVSSADNVMNCSSTASPPLPAISGCVSPGTSSSPATFKIGYASASVLTGSGFWPTSGGLGSNLIYLAGAIDASPTSNPTSVYGATITLTFTIPTNSLASGNATAGFWDINCAASNFPGCLAPPTTGTTPCSASPTAVSGSTTSLTFICSVGNLADLATSKTGVGLMVVMPISTTAPAGTITSNAVIKAASPLTGITSSSASVKIK